MDSKTHIKISCIKCLIIRTCPLSDPMVPRALCLVIKWMVHIANYLPLSSAEVKNVWALHPHSPICLHEVVLKNRGNFTLPYLQNTLKVKTKFSHTSSEFLVIWFSIQNIWNNIYLREENLADYVQGNNTLCQIQRGFLCLPESHIFKNMWKTRPSSQP
jgi:hypothetical protein